VELRRLYKLNSVEMLTDLVLANQSVSNLPLPSGSELENKMSRFVTVLYL